MKNSFELTTGMLERLWKRFHERIQGFADFKNPGTDFNQKEVNYKRDMLRRFDDAGGRGRLDELVKTGKGLEAHKMLASELASNIVSFHSWRASLGTTDKTNCDMIAAYLEATRERYGGPASLQSVFETSSRLGLTQQWDAASTMLWALRPGDFFPIKISYYRALAAELGWELPSGRPDAEKFDTLVEFGRTFYGALKPLQPADWIDVQSFLWCVCPDSYKSVTEKDDLMKEDSTGNSPRCWLIAAGHDGDQWDNFRNEGVVAIGWEGTPDLRNVGTKDEIRAILTKLFPTSEEPNHAVRACWQFGREMKVGDIIVAKQGKTKLLGYGRIDGDYEFREDRRSTHI